MNGISALAKEDSSVPRHVRMQPEATLGEAGGRSSPDTNLPQGWASQPPEPRRHILLLLSHPECGVFVTAARGDLALWMTVAGFKVSNLHCPQLGGWPSLIRRHLLCPSKLEPRGRRSISN